MKDRELVNAIKQAKESEAKKLSEMLWNRYENMVHKHWAILRRQMDNSSLILEQQSDFYSEAYIAFRKALEAIDMSKVENDNWKFLGYFRYYLQNVRTDMISKLLKTYHAEKPFFATSSEGEDVAIVDLIHDIQARDGHKYGSVEQTEMAITEQQAIDLCLKHWDSRRKTIFRLKAKGESNSDVARRLNVHPATITYFMQSMKADVEEALGQPLG